jgi:hypothetical protein
MRHRRGAYRILVGRHGKKRSFGRSRCIMDKMMVMVIKWLFKK